LQLTDLSAEVNGQDLQVDQKSCRHRCISPPVRQGSTLAAHMESEIASSTIRADGQWRLTAGYPGSAQLTFTKLEWRRFNPGFHGPLLAFRSPAR